MSSPYEFVSRGAFSFPLSPRQMWQELERPDRLTGRWRWVGVRRVDPALEQGAELTCVIKPPVPFRMLLDVIVREVTHGELIGVGFRGDLRGRGELRLKPDGEGTLADVWWRFEIMQRGMRAAARPAHPLLRWATTGSWRPPVPAIFGCAPREDADDETLQTIYGAVPADEVV